MLDELGGILASGEDQLKLAATDANNETYQHRLGAEHDASPSCIRRSVCGRPFVAERRSGVSCELYNEEVSTSFVLMSIRRRTTLVDCLSTSQRHPRAI